ncbi:type VI secretion system protein TssA [Pseudescherichia vulneris]
MDISSQHPWHALLLTPLSPEQVALALADDDPEWEFLDSQMVKLGSLAHRTLDLDDIQRRLITLLAQKSKDFRLMVHLLRTLQHGGEPEQLLLAISLLTAWIEHFWVSAAPANAMHKRRFAQQILKRFDSASNSFSQNADVIQRNDARALLAHLAQVWLDHEPVLAKDVDELCKRYVRLPERVVEATPRHEESALPGVAQNIPASVIPSLTVDNSNEKAWRHSILKMADILCQLQPDVAMGYRLRRYAVWGSIAALPMAQSDGRTPLAAVSSDRIADYLARLPYADIPLWQQVEQSLTLAPYWLDGHALSARIATQLGYDAVAQAIREELTIFLARLPGLCTLLFTDMTPFLAPETAAWLQQHQGETQDKSTFEQDEIWQCYQQQGLESALQLLERQPQNEPRTGFYNQLMGAQLLEKSGLTALARQQYHSLMLVGEQLQLREWEPALMALLTEKQRQLKP